MSPGVVSDLFYGNSMAASLTTSPMVLPGNVHDSPPPNPDRPFRRHYNFEYPKELWYFVGSVIFLVAVFQLGSFFHSKFIGRRREIVITDPESPSSATPWDTQFRRLLLAFVNTYRIIAFRCTVGVGSYTLNFAEVFVTAMYIIVVFTWSFVRSKLLQQVHKIL
jgi:ferric-chelate reductase